jgi:hypothetical protein
MFPKIKPQYWLATGSRLDLNKLLVFIAVELQMAQWATYSTVSYKWHSWATNGTVSYKHNELQMTYFKTKS